MLSRRTFLFPTLLSLCLTLLGASTRLQAQPPEPPSTTAVPAPSPSLEQKLATLEKDLEAERVALKIPGMSVAIVKGDKVIFSKGFGYKDVAKKLPVTPDTLFGIGSSTKAFTATAVMMAVEAGKVNLDDRPIKYLPYFKMRDKETDAHITVRDLMRHSSGLARTDLLMIAAEGKLNRQEMIIAACSALPTAKLGQVFQYQNIMYSAAGEIAAGALGKNYNDVVTTRIFAPLGMTRSNLDVKKTLQDPDHALGYNWESSTKTSTFTPMVSIEATAAAGAINSSANEMAQWLKIWTGGGSADNITLLTPSSYAEMTKKQMAFGADGYGFGWFLNTWKGNKVVEHGGNIFGFNANVAFIPDEKIGVVVLTNVFNSPLAERATATVWKNLVTDKSKPVQGETPIIPNSIAEPKPNSIAEKPDQEVGQYEVAGAPVKITIALKDGKLTLTVPGQPTYPLVSTGGRGYKLGEPAPDGFTATFRPKKDKPTVSELELKQPNGTFVFTKSSAANAYKSPLTVDQLLAKIIAATGGERNIKRHKSMVMEITVDFENQGIMGKGTSWGQAPNRSAQRIDLTGAGKKLGWLGSWFDGEKGSSGGSFIPSTPLTGPSLQKAKEENSFLSGIETLKRNSSQIRIVGTKTIVLPGYITPEECYIVEAISTSSKDLSLLYVSTKDFLLRRTDTTASVGEIKIPNTSYLADYRKVDGVVLPFKTINETVSSGRIVQTINKVTFDAPIPAQIFQGPVGK